MQQQLPVFSAVSMQGEHCACAVPGATQAVRDRQARRLQAAWDHPTPIPVPLQVMPGDPGATEVLERPLT